MMVLRLPCGSTKLFSITRLLLSFANRKKMLRLQRFPASPIRQPWCDGINLLSPCRAMWSPCKRLPNVTSQKSVSRQKWHYNTPSNSSWAGRRRYRAPPGNQFLIDVSRFEKYHRKRFAMLKSWQNVPHTIFMQISDAITRKCISRHISANSAHSSTIIVSYPMFWGSKSIINIYSWSDQMCLIYVIA